MNHYIWDNTVYDTHRLWVKGEVPAELHWALNALCLWGGPDKKDPSRKLTSWEFRVVHEESVKSLLRCAKYAEVKMFSEDGV